MKDADKSKSQLLKELTLLKDRVAELEKAETRDLPLDHILLDESGGYQALFENVHDGVFLLDEDSKLKYVNIQAAESLGYSKEELIGRPTSSLVPGSDIPLLEQQIALRKQGQSSSYEIAFEKKNGDPLFAIVSGKPIFDKNGEYKGCFGIVTDITKRKLAEQELIEFQKNLRELADQRTLDLMKTSEGLKREMDERMRVEGYLREAEARYRTLMKNVPANIIVADYDGKILFANETAVATLYDKFVDIVGKTIWDIFTPELATQRLRSIKHVIDSGKEIRREACDFVNSQWRWYDITVQPFRDFVGNTTAAIVIVEDITERRKYKEALKESEAFNKAIVDHLPLGVSVRSRNGKLLAYNEAWKNIWDMTDEDIFDDVNRERTSLQFDEKDSYMGDWQPEVRRIYEEGGYLHIPEVKVEEHRSGLIHWFSQHFYALKDDQGQVERVVILTEDITEHRRAADDLIQSERRFRELTDLLPQTIFETDLSGRCTFANRYGFESTGYSQQDLEKGLGVFQLIVSEDHDRIKRNLELRLKGTIIDDHEYTMRRKDGTTFPVLVYSAPIIRDSQTIGLRGVVIDITQLKRAESELKRHRDHLEELVSDRTRDLVGTNVKLTKEIVERQRAETALKESEERFRLMAQLSPDSIAIIDDGIITFLNPAGLRLLGADRDEQIIGTPIFDVIHPDYKDIISERIRLALDENESGDYMEERMIRLDGTVVDVEAASAPFILNGKKVIQVVARDITERKRVARALQESEERYRRLVETSPDAIVATDLKGVITTANQKAAELLGYARADELIGLDGFGNIVPDQQDKAVENMYKTLKKEITRNIEFDVLRKDGTRFNIEMSVSLIRDLANESSGFIALVRDITRRKKAEEALRESEARLKSAIESMPFDFFALDESGRYILQNSHCRRNWGDLLGKRPEDMDIDPQTKAIWESNNSRALAGETIAEGITYSLEGRGGHYYNIVAPIRDGERIRGILGLNIDITAQKIAEEQLRVTSEELRLEREALEERNVALKQVLNQIDDEKKAIKQQILSNIEQVLIPSLRRLKENLNPAQKKHIENIESNLRTIASPFIDQLRNRFSSLTPREIEICRMIKDGLLSKEISEQLRVSILTVHKHRELIRKKLGIKNAKVNLSSYLQTM